MTMKLRSPFCALVLLFKPMYILQSQQQHQSHSVGPQLTLDEVVQAVHQRQNSSLASSGRSTLTRQQINQVVSQLQQEKLQQEKQQQMAAPYEPRIVMPVMKKSGDLGVRLVRFRHFLKTSL